LSIRRRTRHCRGVKGMLAAGVTVAALASSATAASAQNLLEALFGRLWNSPVSAYADPNAALRNAEQSRYEGGLAYCVRLCDGRYFPIQRHANANPAQACSAFCPASATKIYSGNSIEHSVAPDGKHYSELPTAFTYREKIVPGCTCNGRDAFGLVNTPVADDPTLRPGDIVATSGGLMAYNASPSGGSFTPVSAYAGLSPDMRRQLTETRIEPAVERPAAPPARQAETPPPAGASRSKRAQAER
jgi:hypothetical protein